MGAFTNAFGIGAGQGALLNYNPLTDANIDFLASERSSLAMVDSVGGNNASILLPYLKKTVLTDSITVADNAAFDLNKTTGFTMCGWCKPESVTKTEAQTLFGKGVKGNISGSYMIYQGTTSGYLSLLARQGGVAYTIASTIDFTTQGWTFVRMTLNNTTHKMQFFINETQIDSDLDVVAFSTLAAKYKFLIGSANEGLGASYISYPAQASFKDVAIYPFVLTPEQGAAQMAGAHISGALAFWSLSDNFRDASGNNYHLTGDDAFAYSADGSKHLIDVGYSVWKRSDSRDIIMPYKIDGTVIATAGLPTGYAKYKDYPTDQSALNLVPAKIQLGSQWDRSNVLLFNDFCRLSKYYNAANPTAWHVNELNQFNINNYCTPAHLGKIFVKVTPNSITNRESLLSIFSSSVQKVGGTYNSVLRFTGDYAVMPPPVEIDYYYTDKAYVAINENKILAFDDLGTLLLSSDNGVTFPISLETTLTIIKYAWIFNDGNIMFCDDTKMYYSDDNLDTYQESTVLDISGSVFTPTLYDNFTPIIDDEAVIIDGVEHKAFGNYSNEPETEYINMNVWHTYDGGVTLRSVYKALTTGTPSAALPARHVHTVKYISEDNSWMLTTGDGVNECNWIKGTSVDNFTTWTWTRIKGGNSDSFYKTTGVSVILGKLFLFGDATGRLSKNGVWTIPYDKITDETYFRQVYETAANGASSFEQDGVFICVIAGGKYIIVSKDGINFHPKTLTGGPSIFSMPTRGVYRIITRSNTLGYHKLGINQADEDFRDAAKGVSLMLKVK